MKRDKERRAMPLGAAHAFLVENFQSPQRLLDELAAGRMPCWDVSGNALGAEFWRSRPAVNFKESSARSLVDHSPSGEPIYGPWHYGIAVSGAHVRALPDAPVAVEGPPQQ